ncbi:glucose 1-dehydrogenase [Mesorhizobium sp. M1312]|uniref:SDR family NAD(P)-dependent oxidoreductase n=1 Tax=unclassified Mesorhizobium TaxID=325217 RepID=UPI00333B1370
MILKDRIAVVTGAGSGIGRAGAMIIAREGAVVVIADRDQHAGEATASDIRAAGGQAEAIATDVGEDVAVEQLITGTLGKHGRIDILHNHAGVQVGGTLTEVGVDGMDASWRINVRAQFLAARLVMPSMIEQGGGVILNTASNSGVFYDREMIAYATSKHAVVAMTRQMSLDYAKHKVRVNALCPGWVDTPFNEPFIAQMGGRDAIECYVRTKIPMQRWASAEEIAEAILFLVSDRSSFMTGQALVIDGGESIG